MRFFNTAGPVNCKEHYCLSPLQRFNLDQIVLSAIHKSPSRKPFMDFDIDVKDPTNFEHTLKMVKRHLGKTKYHVIKTRGGAHVLVDKTTLDPNIKHTFYQGIKNDFKNMREVYTIDGEIENLSDTMIPIPGCVQGGNVPYLEK